jgi:hypothetical protein
LDDGQLVFSAVPTGVFVDTAMSLVTRFVPKPSLEERRAALIAAGKLAQGRLHSKLGMILMVSSVQLFLLCYDILVCPQIHVEEHRIN